MNEYGQPNSAYLHAGEAVRKAMAAGFHKFTAVSRPEFETIQTTFWTCYVSEMSSCSFSVGTQTVLTCRTELYPSSLDGPAPCAKTTSRFLLLGIHSSPVLFEWRISCTAQLTKSTADPSNPSGLWRKARRRFKVPCMTSIATCGTAWDSESTAILSSERTGRVRLF